MRGTALANLLRTSEEVEDEAFAETLRRAVRGIADQLPLHLVEPVSVRMTGPVALEYEELVSVSRGVARSGLLALIVVLGILAFALRSVSLVVALSD